MLGNVVLFLAFASLRRADSVALECSPRRICSYFTNLWPVHLNNHEMIHQLVSFTFHNFHSLLSPLSHGSLHALAANSNGRPAFKRGCSSICYSVFVLFSSNYGVINIKISDLQPRRILFLFDILTFWTMRRTSCVYRGAAAEGVKHCLQGIVHVRVREMRCPTDQQRHSFQKSIWSQCVRLFPSRIAIF